MKTRHVEVKICVGAACFVQGGADLLLYEEFLDPIILSKCTVTGSPCLGTCKYETNATMKAPFVEINGKTFGSVTVDRLAQLIEEALHA